MLEKTQTLFANNILQDADNPQLRELLQQYSREEAAARLAIYKNNFYRSLTDILLDTFASIQQLIGNENFDHLAREFISQHPPSNPTISLYGEAFPRFLRAHTLSQEIPYLADCANLDWALHCAYYKEDANPVAAETFLESDPNNLMQCQFEFHAATQLLQSNYCIFSIREFLNSDNQAEQISFDRPENVLICRNQHSVEHYLVETATGAFIQRLIQKKNLEQAISGTMQQYAAFNPSEALSFLIQTQVITKIQGVR